MQNQCSLFEEEVEASAIKRPSIRQLIQDGALFCVNHSGGKDSQAMLIKIARVVPHDQIIIIHSHLPEVEWEGTKEHIEATSFGIPLRICQAKKTFFEMVLHRQMWPSPKNRQCTSDLKRGPLEKLIRSIAKERGKTLIVSCMGLRAQESTGRKNKTNFKLSEGNSVAGRTWYEWLPIHQMKLERVWKTIKSADQKPFWIYAKGMSRKSCAFCIMSNKSDLRIASQLRPELYERYLDIERTIKQTLMMPVKGIALALDKFIK